MNSEKANYQQYRHCQVIWDNQESGSISGGTHTYEYGICASCGADFDPDDEESIHCTNCRGEY